MKALEDDDDYLVRMRHLLMDTQSEVDRIIGAAPNVNAVQPTT